MRLSMIMLVAVTGCTALQPPPQHELVGVWTSNNRRLELSQTEYRTGAHEKGWWHSETGAFLYTEDPAPLAVQRALERCDFALAGETLELSKCRLAGRYQRTNSRWTF